MLEIGDVAYQKMDVFSRNVVYLDNLADLGTPGPVVVHEGQSAHSLVVESERVTEIFANLPSELYRGQPLSESPLTPYLGRGQMSAHQTMSAAAVIALAEWQNIGYVIVEGDDHRPTGLVGVAYVRDMIATTDPAYSAGVASEIGSMLTYEGLASVIEVLDRHFAPGEFRSNIFSQTAPPAPWCGTGANGHYVSQCPCREHRDRPCSIR